MFLYLILGKDFVFQEHFIDHFVVQYTDIGNFSLNLHRNAIQNIYVLCLRWNDDTDFHNIFYIHVALQQAVMLSMWNVPVEIYRLNI